MITLPAIVVRRLRPAALLLTLLAIPGLRATAQVAPGWRFAGKSAVATARRSMVVSANIIASEVGRDILRQGGNAVDAAVAVGFALQVTHPEAGNIGGGGFMMIRLANGRTAALDYRETAPAAASRDMYLDSLGAPTERSVTGHLAAGVPGAVAGLHTAHRRFGKLPWRTVVQPAIDLAAQGFIVDDYRHRAIEGAAPRLARFDGSRAAYLPDGAAPAAGTRWRQPELAATLTAIRDHGAAGFYRGPVADLIVAEMARGGGIITRKDLAGYRARWRKPITIRYRGHTILSTPPASSGGVALAEMFQMLEGTGPLPPFGSTALLHLEAEVMRRAFIDRNRYLGDPDFVRMPLARLTSAAHADSLRATIGDRATPTPPFDPMREGTNTTHYSVVDEAGNAVSCTTTLNNSFGSAVTVSGAGFLLNDEMDDFATAPGKPNMYGLVQGEANAIRPGKRMLSAMTPTIVLGPDGEVKLVVGTPGGPTIITQVYHVISNVLDHGMALPDAVAAPRLHHQALPDSIRVEAGGFLPAVLDSLRARGHGITERAKWGDVQAILRTPAGWVGVSDPRLAGGGAGD